MTPLPYTARKKVNSMNTKMQCTFCDSEFQCYARWYEHIMEHLRSEAEISLSELYWKLVLKPIMKIEALVH